MYPQGILFDLDNTLVDWRRSIAAYAIEFRSRFSAALDEIDTPALTEVLVEADGGGYRQWSELSAGLLAALPWRSKPAAAELERHWQTAFPPAARGMAGLGETLEALHSLALKMGIVTNGGSASQNAKIDALAIRPYMSAIVISEEAGVSKPDPAIFDAALERLGLRAGQTWFVGDNPAADILGAASAGLTPVWMRGSHPWPDGHPPPKLQIDSLPELLPLIDAAQG